jgi:hypothetical protein
MEGEVFWRWVVRIDNFFFKGRYQARYGHPVDIVNQASLGSDLAYKIVSHYRKDPDNELAKLCDYYGSDKGEIQRVGHPYPWPSHTYTDYYSRLFAQSRNSILKVFECGVGTNNPKLPSSMGAHGKPGASLRVWRDYFPNATIWGADIDDKCLFQEERIRTHYVDQLDAKSIQDFWEWVGVQDFDLIVDDGLHTFEAGSSLFLNSIDNLSTSGIYIIEDVGMRDLQRYKDYFKDTVFLVDYVCLFRPDKRLMNNNLVVVRKSS